MGTDHLHAPDPRAAERASNGATHYAHSGRSDLGAGIRALQEALQRATADRSRERHLAPSHIESTLRRSDQGERMTMPRIAYAGMTHLGICSAIAAASKGFATLGFSVEGDIVAALAAGRLPVIEPELDDLLL